MPDFIYQETENFPGPGLPNFKVGKLTKVEVDALADFFDCAYRTLVKMQNAAAGAGYGRDPELRLSADGNEATAIVTAKQTKEVHDYKDPDVRDMPGGNATIVHRTGVDADASAVSIPDDPCEICNEAAKDLRRQARQQAIAKAREALAIRNNPALDPKNDE